MQVLAVLAAGITGVDVTAAHLAAVFDEGGGQAGCQTGGVERSLLRNDTLLLLFCFVFILGPFVHLYGFTCPPLHSREMRSRHPPRFASLLAVAGAVEGVE